MGTREAAAPLVDLVDADPDDNCGKLPSSQRQAETA